MDMTTAIADPTSDEMTPFWLQTRPDIEGVLHQLRDVKSPITIYFNDMSDHVVTNLLDVNTEFEEMIFDWGADEASTRSLLDTHKSTCVTFVRNVKLQFELRRMYTTAFQGNRALRARIPEAAIWYQRRRCDRIGTPVVNPLKCIIPAEAAGGIEREAIVLDISCGGLAIAMPLAEHAYEPGALIAGCSLALPGRGVVNFNLEARDILNVVERANPPMRRYGCRFVEPHLDVLDHVSQYIDDLLSQRRARM